MRKIKKFLLTNLRKTGLLLINFTLNYRPVLKAIGAIIKIKTVFVAYPASEEYTKAYVFQFCKDWLKWKPWLAGIFKQNQEWGLMFIVTATEKEFISSNFEQLKFLMEEMEKKRSWLGADQKTFAGILPGVLSRCGLLGSSVEREVTVTALLRAEERLRQELGYPQSTPLILLGGKGFIGEKLAENLHDRDIRCVDVNSHPNEPNLQEWPRDIEGSNAILINLTRSAVISLYSEFFWDGLVLLNEAYPPPKKEEIGKIKEKGGSAFHLAGVKAQCCPSFPKDYYGGIPCCAGWPSPEIEVILRKK